MRFEKPSLNRQIPPRPLTTDEAMEYLLETFAAAVKDQWPRGNDACDYIESELDAAHERIVKHQAAQEIIQRSPERRPVERRRVDWSRF